MTRVTDLMIGFRVSTRRLLVGKEIEKEKRILLIGLSPNSDPKALRPLSKRKPKRLTEKKRENPFLSLFSKFHYKIA